ncbi:MAG TPA: hypothetical protein VMF06_23220 [Candidatus Limnocylindria bacterium]|jgi:hypothetical protein|nr:hypothetical protein [Candidatus Limnocylindria bacterium]
MSDLLRRTIHPQTKILDAAKGIAEYLSSDESVDSYKEIIRADGWLFDRFGKNAPFVNSHDYGSIDSLLGKVIESKVVGRSLIQTVQWAIDVAENRLAKFGWAMTVAGYLKAVSVGFMPVRMATRWDADQTMWLQQLKDLEKDQTDGVRVVYIKQQQIELSTVVIGANANAVQLAVKGYKSGEFNDADIQFLSEKIAQSQPASAAKSPGHAASEASAQARRRRLFLDKFEKTLKGI